MKKLIIFISLLLLPNIAFAVVTENTEVIGSPVIDKNDIGTLCRNAEKDNENYKNATSGYYLECVAVKCNNNTNEHFIDKAFSSNVTCANGNKNPYYAIVDSGLKGGIEGESLEKGASCTVDTNVANAIDTYGMYAYGTRIYNYDCNFINDDNKTPYNTNVGDNTGNDNNQSNNNNNINPPVNDNNQTNNSGSSTGNNNNNLTDSPETGIEDYYTILIPSIIVISVVLYFVNKKSMFKKF